MRKLMGLFLLYSFILAGQVWADEKDLYDFLWLDPDKSVYVLQNKVLEKEHSFYLNVGLLKGFSTDFQSTYGFGGRLGYFFNEEWGVEVLYHKFQNSDDEAFKNIRTVNGVVPFVRRINSYYAAMATWAPFYGKINTFNHLFTLTLFLVQV